MEKFGYREYPRIDEDKFHDLNFNIIRIFPKELVLEWISQDFDGRNICYHSCLHIEVVKYIYYIWNDYVELSEEDLSYPDKELCHEIHRIKNHLIETANMDPKEYYDILENKSNPRYNQKKNYIYYTWWLYVYYPLLDNFEELILKLINFVYLSDAQDMLLYGIYQIEPQKLSIFIKKFMLTLWQQDEDRCNQHAARYFTIYCRPCFCLWDSATGAWTEMIRILKKLYDNGYDLLSDPELEKIFQYTNRDDQIVNFKNEVYDDIKMSKQAENHDDASSALNDITMLSNN